MFGFIYTLCIVTTIHSLSQLSEQDKHVWEQQADQLEWYTRWSQVYCSDGASTYWFKDATINACNQCLDVHIRKNRGQSVALQWSNERCSYKTVTYEQLYYAVNKFSAYLLSCGVKEGDIVVIYLPMIPEAVVAMLSCARIGAVHCVVFSGFSYQALHERVTDTQARFVITCDVAYYRGKELKLKAVVDQALDQDTSVDKVVFIKRTQGPVAMTPGRDYEYREQEMQRCYVEPRALESHQPLFILYTSGTTGKPKGIVHGLGGYLTHVYATLKWAFDIKQHDVYWCTADIGWITGHSYVVYAPLMHGATVVMREGAPDYPDENVWWSLIDRLNVTIFYTSPTALRMFMRLGDELFAHADLTSLRVLGSVGETLNPEVWRWYFDTIGHKRCPIIDTWWQTETGGFMIAPQMSNLLPLKPGSVSKPMPTIHSKVVDKDGNQVSATTKGYLVLTSPWPGMALGIFNKYGGFDDIYCSKFKNSYFTGDYAYVDEDGYFWILGRADDVIKVSGHRIGAAELESVVLEHGAVAESAVIGVSDAIKGESIVIFVVLKNDYKPYNQIDAEIAQLIRTKIGPFASPRTIYCVKKLPKNRSGKIMRRLLKALAEGLAIGDISTLEEEISLEEIQQLINAVSIKSKNRTS